MHCEMINGKELRIYCLGIRDAGCNAKDNRLFVEAVLYRYRAGIPWRFTREIRKLEKYSQITQYSHSNDKGRVSLFVAKSFSIRGYLW